MTEHELTLLNIGQSLDDIMNIDPRGYGVCRILYEAAREKTGEPLSIHGAKTLLSSVHEKGLVYVITGFILPVHGKPETDGLVGSALLARALVTAFNAKPVIICPDDCLVPLGNALRALGLHQYDTIQELQKYPVAAAVIPFTKDAAAADALADALIADGLPDLVISTEAPGANEYGRYHNATGIDVTAIEAKSDHLFERLKQRGVPNIAIGDLGNEIGMGTIGETLKTRIPYAAGVEPRDSIAVVSTTDTIITATVSDWGMNALISALALLKENINIMHTPEMEKDALTAAARGGAVDMTGWILPAIDGVNLETNMMSVGLMRGIVEHAIRNAHAYNHWFEKTIALGGFDKGIRR